MAVINHADRLKVGTTEVWRAYKDSGIVYDLQTAVSFPGLNGNYDNTPDDVSLHLAGPFSLVVHKLSDFVVPGNFAAIVSMWPGGWIWDLTSPTGSIRFVWNDGGTKTILAGSVTDYDGWPWVAVTFDPDDDGVARARMWRSTDGSAWDQIATNTDPNNTSPNYSGGAGLRVASRGNGLNPLAAGIARFEYRDGVGLGGEPGGSAVAIRDYSKPITPYTDALGNTWMLNGSDWRWINTATGQPLN